MRPERSVIRVVGILSWALVLVSGTARGAGRYDPGASDAQIKIGNTMPYSGPASALGVIGHTMAAYFRRLNDEGGINGRKVQFISLDDGYSPPKTVEHVRALVEREQVLLIFGSLGTPTNSAVQKYLNANRVPQLFIVSAAAKFNDPKTYPWTMGMGWGLSFLSEGRLYARYITQKRPNSKIAVLYQNDDSGRELLKGLKQGLESATPSMLVAEASYEVTDPTVDSQIVNLKGSGADTFVNFATTPRAAIQSLVKAYDSGWRPTTFMYSGQTVIDRVLKPVGLEKTIGLISAVGLKDITAPEWREDPAVVRYRSLMAKYYPAGDPDELGNWYAYMLAHTLEHVLKECGDDLTRDNVMRKATSLQNYQVPMLLPGVLINTSPTDYAMIHQARMERFDGTRWVPFGELLDGR